MTYPLACDTILFDLDGTLVDSAPDLLSALNHVLELNGYPTVHLSQVRDMVGGGAKMLLSRAMRGTDIPPEGDEELEEAVRMFIAFYGDHLLDHTLPFPGVGETLIHLRQEGYLLGVVTNKPEWLSRKLLDGLAMEKLFSVIVGGDSLSERKPHPLPLFHALERAGGKTGIMVGDSETDVAAARAANMPVVAVSYGYNRGQGVAELEPDRVVHHFGELPSLLIHSSNMAQ